MSAVILFESEEWSNFALNKYIQETGLKCKLINLEKCDLQDVLTDITHYDLVINRIFASAQFRGHHKSLRQIEKILNKIKTQDIILINPYEAHFYEVSKYKTAQTLSTLGIPVPQIYCRFKSNTQPDYNKIKFPCVLKPDCGGRSNYTYILKNKAELESVLKEIKNCNFEFVIQKYIEPTRGYTTRIEIIGAEIHSIMKRTIGQHGLASYNLGSEYKTYADCALKIKKTALNTMRYLNVEMGSLDIIENDIGHFVIDVNSVTNFEQQNIEEFGFNLIKDMARYIVDRYKIELNKS